MNFDQGHLWHPFPIFLQHQVIPKEGWNLNSKSQLHFSLSHVRSVPNLVYITVSTKQFYHVQYQVFVMYCIKNYYFWTFINNLKVFSFQNCLFPNWILADTLRFLFLSFFLNFLTMNKTIICLLCLSDALTSCETHTQIS